MNIIASKIATLMQKKILFCRENSKMVTCGRFMVGGCKVYLIISKGVL